MINDECEMMKDRLLWPFIQHSLFIMSSVSSVPSMANEFWSNDIRQ